jgi:uncharacterized protein YndB with AHSA1/START domain
MKDKPVMADQIKSNIVIERSYKAEPDDVWALWTTKAGFESWWGPEGFRADVHMIEAQLGGTLHYDMVADSPTAIAAMKDMGEPTSTPCRGHFSEFRPQERLALSQIIDFLPGVEPYDSLIEVDIIAAPDGHVRMIVTLHQMHDVQTTKMQHGGFLSQLSKLDKRYGWQG